MSYTTQRLLTEDEQKELDQLNYNIAQSLGARQLWLDRKMEETSRLKVGDDIYDVQSGRRLGTVSKLYRYHKGRNDLLDNSYYCDYQYQTSQHSHDNTSRQIGLRFGTREDAIEETQRRVSYLQQ